MVMGSAQPSGVSAVLGLAQASRVSAVMGSMQPSGVGAVLGSAWASGVSVVLGSAQAGRMHCGRKAVSAPWGSPAWGAAESRDARAAPGLASQGHT